MVDETDLFFGSSSSFEIDLVRFLGVGYKKKATTQAAEDMMQKIIIGTGFYNTSVIYGANIDARRAKKLHNPNVVEE